MSGALHEQRGTDRVAVAFAQALADRDESTLKFGLLLCERYQLTAACLEPLHALVVASWHTWHESLIIALMRIGSPSSVEPLYAAAWLIPPPGDDEHGTAVRAILALRKIQSARAIERLGALLVEEREVVRHRSRAALQEIVTSEAADPAVRELAQRMLAAA